MPAVPVDPQEIEKKIVACLKKVLKANDSLNIFKNAFVFSEIGSTGSIYAKYYVNIQSSVATQFDNNERAGLINILNFSPRDVTPLTLAKNDTTRRSGRSAVPMFLNVYNSLWRDFDTSKKLGINISKKVNIKGYCMNYVDVKKYIAECVDRRGEAHNDLRHQINQFYFITPRNILLAISAVDGQLLIRRQALEKLISQNEESKVIEALDNLLVCHYKLIEKYMDLNITDYKKEMLELVENNSRLRILDYIQSCNNNNIDQYLPRIKEDVKRYMVKLLENTVFGATDNYSYQRLLSQAVNKRKDLEQALFQDAFKKGMQIGLKLEMLGWRSCNVSFPDHTNMSDIWWVKDVKIIPDSLMKGGKRYIIPEKHRSYYCITKLYINQDGMMRAEGKHPNVSGSRVCMGDLKISFVDDLSAMQENFIRIETLLDMINYDSAYDHNKESELLGVSKLDNLYDMNVVSNVTYNGGIREVSFGGEEDEEIPQPVAQPRDRDPVLTPAPINAAIVNDIDSRRNTAYDAIESDNYVRTARDNFYQAEERVAGIVGFVDGDGNVITVNAPTPVPVIANTVLRLGDANIIRTQVNGQV